MKKQLLGLLLGVLLIFGCVGCGEENTTTEPTKTATETITEESTIEQTKEATATTEETTAPTPEATEEPSEETTTEPETEPTEIAEPEPTEEPTPEPQAIYTYTDMSATMYAQQTVNVRDLPDTNGNKVGSLSTNDEITISGQCNETSWYRFEYNGNVAYVSNKYVGENKVEIQQAPTDNSTADTGNASTSSNYEKNVWYDMGEYYFIMCNSQEEADYYFGHHYEVSPTLEARYPDRKVYIIGRPNYVTLVAALHPTSEGFPNWSEINYIPEIGIN